MEISLTNITGRFYIIFCDILYDPLISEYLISIPTTLPCTANTYAKNRGDPGPGAIIILNESILFHYASRSAI
jgi:hypothetical protein